MLKKVGVGLATLGVVVSTTVEGYLLFIRPWHARWGATDEEIDRAMPGDDEVQHPLMAATRAVTITARPDEIWPWLVQIGTGRAGWYSYDWIENLIGLGVTSAQRIIPEFQHLKVGDMIPLSPGLCIPVKAIEPTQSLLLVGHDPIIGDTSWSFGLYPLDKRHTRLVSRYLGRWPLTLGGIFWLLITDPGLFLMMRKMLLGIKQRAERASSESATNMQSAQVQSPDEANVRTTAVGSGEYGESR